MPGTDAKTQSTADEKKPETFIVKSLDLGRNEASCLTAMPNGSLAVVKGAFRNYPPRSTQTIAFYHFDEKGEVSQQSELKPEIQKDIDCIAGLDEDKLIIYTIFAISIWNVKTKTKMADIPESIWNQAYKALHPHLKHSSALLDITPEAHWFQANSIIVNGNDLLLCRGSDGAVGMAILRLSHSTASGYKAECVFTANEDDLDDLQKPLPAPYVKIINKDMKKYSSDKRSPIFIWNPKSQVCLFGFWNDEEYTDTQHLRGRGITPEGAVFGRTLQMNWDQCGIFQLEESPSGQYVMKQKRLTKCFDNGRAAVLADGEHMLTYQRGEYRKISGLELSVLGEEKSLASFTPQSWQSSYSKQRPCFSLADGTVISYSADSIRFGSITIIKFQCIENHFRVIKTVPQVREILTEQTTLAVDTQRIVLSYYAPKPPGFFNHQQKQPPKAETPAASADSAPKITN